MTVEARIGAIAKNWFYSEPLLFGIYCTHSLVKNDSLSVPMRTGQMRIEFSSQICQSFNDQILEEVLKLEIFRILLQHPYTRRPSNCKPGILLVASDVTINHFYKSSYESSGVLYLKSMAGRFAILENPLGKKWSGTDEEKFFQRNLQIEKSSGQLKTIDDLSFEKWYSKILFLVKTVSSGGENAGSSGTAEFCLPSDEASELWEENPEVQEAINDQIQKAEIDEGWGETGGGLTRKIRESSDFSFNYRKALTQFRQHIVSANRVLTRMRPSRRFGFKQMGSRYERKANILIAVDVSGSITDESFERFYHAIKNFFFLGLIEHIDLIFFDVNLKNTKAVPFTRNFKLQEISGRGGTSFQPAFDYLIENYSKYSGMIIFTDGEGMRPVISKNKTKVLWILQDRLSFERNKYWINSIPGNTSSFLP